MKKHLLKLWILLLFVAALFALPMTAQAETSGTCGANLTWVLDDEGTLTISGTGAMSPYKPSGPWGVDVKRVVINEGVTNIGYSAFYDCSNLTSITIPKSVISIDHYALTNCSSLTSITIPDGVTSIGSGAFDNCSSLTSITIPDGVTSIGNVAFYNCSSLTSITIPEGVSTIGDSTFNNCISLASIKLPQSLTSIGRYAFHNCASLTRITLPDDLTSIGDYAFCDCSSLTSIAIPDSVTSIGENVFSECSGLTSITIPDGVPRIGRSAFYGCSSLTSITIPEGVVSIGRSAFYGCSNLTSITLPNSITSIGEYAFDSCSGLTSITLPNSVTSIGENTFYKCTGLTSVTLPKNVTSIGASAFWSCSGLTSITIPEGVTSIGEFAFNSCTSLSEITIPESLTSVGSYGFGNCPKLTSITIPEGMTQIATGTFAGCTSLTKITIPESLTSIGSSAFENCPKLTSITIPEGVTSIGEFAFNNCVRLNKVAFYGDRMPAIGGHNWGWTPTVYCYEFSEIDFWAAENGFPVVYLDADDPSIGLTISLPDSLELWTGECNAITADVFPPVNASLLTWESSDTKVATVDQTGRVTALKHGTTVVTLSCGDVLEQTIVSVRQSAESFDLSETEVWIVSKASAQLSAMNIKPANVDGPVAWSSSDSAICTVADDGLISALRPGTATVTAAIGSVSRTCTVHVTYPVDSINFSSDALTLTVGDTHQLTANVITRNGQTLENKLVVFSSDNSSVATVDENGLVTALQIGTVKITATASNGVSANCAVTVKTPILGDVNEDDVVNVSDALIVLQYSAGWNVKLNTNNADVNKDGIIGLSDALRILQDCMGGDIAKAMRALQRMLADLNGSSLVIIEQPADQCVMAGETATFIVTATGDALKYQWYIDRNDGTGWQKLNNANDVTYVTSKTEADNDGYQYRCVITDAHGNEATTDVAVLHVVLDMPNTGDASTPALWLTMCMLSMIGLMILKRREAIK